MWLDHIFIGIYNQWQSCYICCYHYYYMHIIWKSWSFFQYKLFLFSRNCFDVVLSRVLFSLSCKHLTCIWNLSHKLDVSCRMMYHCLNVVGLWNIQFGNVLRIFPALEHNTTLLHIVLCGREITWKDAQYIAELNVSRGLPPIDIVLHKEDKPLDSGLPHVDHIVTIHEQKPPPVMLGHCKPFTIPIHVLRSVAQDSENRTLDRTTSKQLREKRKSLYWKNDHDFQMICM